MHFNQLIAKANNQMKRWIAVNLLDRPVVKIHGLLRVGTNYMQALLTENFNVVCLDALEGGWKHGPCIYEPHKKYVFVVKNPYAWLVSFRDWENIHNRSTTKSLAEFVAQPLSHERLKEEWGTITPVEVWNRTLTSWLTYYGKGNAVFIRYESLINDVETQLSYIRDNLGLKMRNTKFVNIGSRVDTWETPNPRKAFQVDYYRDEKYLEEFDEQALAILREQLDRNLLSKFNYQMY